MRKFTALIAILFIIGWLTGCTAQDNQQNVVDENATYTFSEYEEMTASIKAEYEYMNSTGAQVEADTPYGDFMTVCVDEGIVLPYYNGKLVELYPHGGGWCITVKRIVQLPMDLVSHEYRRSIRNDTNYNVE